MPILTELAGKLQGKFRWDHDRVAAAVRHVAPVVTVVKPTERLSVLADEPDNRILECAAAAGAQFIVTGDRHLLDVETHEGVSVVTLAAFLCAAGPNGAPSA